MHDWQYVGIDLFIAKSFLPCERLNRARKHVEQRQVMGRPANTSLTSIITLRVVLYGDDVILVLRPKREWAFWKTISSVLVKLFELRAT